MNSSEKKTEAQHPRGLPIGRYLLVLLVAALGFMALAMVEESEVFLPLFGLGEPPGPKVVVGKAALAGAKRAQAAVKRFNAAVERALRTGSVAALPASEAVKKALTQAIAFAHKRYEPPQKLERQTLVSVEPTSGGGWNMLTDEVWSWPQKEGTAAGRSRLRFRYTLVPQKDGLRVEEMKPVLPEPNFARAR